MNGFKKTSVRILILLYGLSYLLQNTFFVDRKKVYAAENPSTTNLVAIFIDKNIYQDIKTNLIRYTTQYLQKKIANSKAVVFPIDTSTLKAHEISQILENVYFEGLKDESSKLVGTILIGNIPLPVVENNGFIYPSIFPYVDFEKQEFIYDTNKKFFVYNNNPNGQAEIWHSIIKFDATQQYNDFFKKVKSYHTNPTTFIDKAIWYEDFIGLKKYFIPENTKYYTNSIIFSEDVGYHRFNNLLLNILKSEHNDSALAVGNDLETDLQNVTDPELKAYAQDMATRNDEAEEGSQAISSNMPTLTLKTATQEMLKGYDGLISSQFLSKINTNIGGLARRYKTNEGSLFTDYSSVTDKIAQKDNRIVGDIDNNIQPLLIQMNEYLENGLNTKIEEEKYYMTIPIPVSELDFAGGKKGLIKKKCVWNTYNYYENYYFGVNANVITSAEQTSIYRGTYSTGQNSDSISGQTITTNPLQSIGGAYNIFSTQIEANRGYDFSTTQEELQKYAVSKTYKKSLRQLKCTKYFLGMKKILGMEGICMKPRSRTVNNNADENKCYLNDQSKQGGCESLLDFSARNRGGASPMNMDSTTLQLKNYNYKNAVLPIYNIAGAKKIDTAQPDANSYQGISSYTTLIQKRFAVGDLQNGSNSVSALITNPNNNGSTIIFTNQRPVGNLEHPSWVANPPKTYAQTNFFTLFNAMPSRMISAGKAVIYKKNGGACGGDGNIYTYKTIDSRIRNISPTWDQISDTEFYKFKDPSDVYVFYTTAITNLAQTKTDIVQTTMGFSGANSEDMTGVTANLSKLKTIISDANTSIKQIITFNPASLPGWATGQVKQVANTRSSTTINLPKIAEIYNRIGVIATGLDELLDYMNGLNINSLGASLDGIVKSERLKNQKVEILDSWKANITQNFEYVVANVNTLKSTFINAWKIYNSIGKLNNDILLLQAKKTAIAGVAVCGVPTALPCGCDGNHYKAMCDVIDNLTAILQTHVVTINDALEKIHKYQEDGVTTQPFIEINQEFTSPSILEEISQAKTTINTFAVSTDAEKKEKNKGMNLTTQDRPIDNIRNITFQGIAGDTVRLNYPNLYEVEVFKKVDNKLVLKSQVEIREAIKTYLTNKAVEYNTLLQTQKNKKNQYYQSFSKQFSFLGTLDPLANPNTHNYNLLPTDFFISQLISYLDTLQNSPEYGKEAIYGKSNAATIDDKLDMIAKLLNYQNITWPEKLQQSTVIDDLTETKNSFDINTKISNIMNTYLTEGNDQGKFITPTYNTTGYEVGYINSDGEDYIAAKSVPTFIQQIQNIQEQSVKAPANQYREDTSSAANFQKEVDSCEGVDSKGTALLFDFKTFKSPWIKAMACRLTKTIKKPFDIKIGFKNALGPVFMGTLKDIGNSLDTAGGQWEEYGNQRNVPNNDDTINQTDDADMRAKLQSYNNYAIVNIDKTIIGVDDTGNAQINISMAQDVGNISVKITGTGDNCFAIQEKQTTISSNVCTTPAKSLFNPNTEKNPFSIILNKKTAGTTALMIELCPPSSKTCITKQLIINILPGPIKTITLKTPTDIVMEGGEIPLTIAATDRYDNTIGQNIQAYTISVHSGDGKIYDGASANSSITFDNFQNASFIYQAPIGITANTGIVVTIAPDQTENLLGASESAPMPLTVQKKIMVVKGVVTVLQNNTVLYQTNTQQNIQPKITFNLPKDETAIQYQDTDGIAQIRPEDIPSLVITVKDKNGNILDTVANITSTRGLLAPGTVQEKSVIQNNSSKKQILFNQANDFIVKDGRLDIALYPTFKAGNDIITINIPGIAPINIPVVVAPGAAKTVLLKLEKSRMDFTSTSGSKGTIHVVDSRNNKVTQATAIKLGVIGAAESNVTEFTYSGDEYTYTLTAKKPGGEGYVFAYIKDRELTDQVPAYARFIVQESVIPKDKLNVMYLNLFGTDRGNQRGYFSENDKVVNTITNQSNKLLATTTQLVDPNKIKQIEYIIDPHGQIQSISTKASSLTIENKEIISLMPSIAKIHLGASNTYKITQLADSGGISTLNKTTNMLVYISEPTDSVITGNEASKSKIIINGKDVIDLVKGTIDPTLTITADDGMLGDMSSYTMTLNEKTIGKLMLWSNDSVTANAAHIDLQDPITYGKTAIFTEGSTNAEGIGIYIHASAFTKQGYQSIEDSTAPMLGIGFTSNFKNVANFVNGKNVGEATLPYGSQFLINFGDPLVQRKDKNTEIPTTDFDASIGQTIYADPNKTIFKVLPIDFNKDGIEDLIAVYTDGTVKLLKNYGGTNPYKDLQELMIIAEPIKDIKIGDVDGNGYDDIFVITNNNKGIVYLNERGMFPVDGKNVCLNVNAEPDTMNATPDDFTDVQQMFVEDMDKDGKLDVITHDSWDDIKIFYGGGNGNGANYLSMITGACDNNRYTRQKNNYKIVKRFGVKINSSRYIQDDSLIHRKGGTTPVEGTVEEKDVVDTDGTEKMSQSQIVSLKDQTMNSIKDMVNNNDMYITAGSAQLAYTENPLSTSPIYESLPADEISYLPINEANDAVSVYKEYQDMNGGVLRKDDEVVVKTTILSKKNNNRLTYIDQLQGPRNITKDDTTNAITSFVWMTSNTGGLMIDRNPPEGYQFVMDNIRLDSGEAVSFSYRVRYQAQKPIISIDVKDQDLLQASRYKDGYPDITINSTDACQKNRRILFNDKTGIKRNYEQVYDDIQQKINEYNSGAQAGQEDNINSIVDQLSNIDNLDKLSSLPGLNNMESRSPKNLLSSLISQGGGLSLNINTSFIDNATAKVSKKLDSALQGLCQGFQVGKGGCQGIPVPFNQAFLAPGDYHIFGCVPQIPNPLYGAFATLNKTIGKGMPLLNIPGNRGPTPVGYIPAPGFFGYPFKGATDNFFLGTPGGPYPSQFRLYIAPTLTLGLGMAMCFGPYTVGSALPKPFRDLGGNCVVFALPPLTKCSSTNEGGDTSQSDTYDPGLVSAAAQGTCNNPPRIGNTLIFASDESNNKTITETANSPFQIVAAGSSENHPSYAAAIPYGNFGGLISIDQNPTRVSASEAYGNATEQLKQGISTDGYQLQKGETIDLKILGGKAKGLVKCVVQDRFTRQIQYFQNNLTKMTIQIDLPDVTTLFQGFDKIGNLEQTYTAINQADQSKGYIQSSQGKGADLTPNSTGGDIARTDKLSKQNINNLSQKIGQNPFEAIQQIFNEVPLVNIDTKDLTIKIPAITSDDINKYVSYLTLWVAKADAALQDRDEFFASITNICNTKAIKDQINNSQGITKQITDLEKLESRGELNAEQKAQLDNLKQIQKQIAVCLKLSTQSSKFISFKENTAGIISSVKANINVLEKYKEFPTQLYQRTHLTDRYLTELSALLSNFVGGINNFLDINATRFSQYVDALTLIIGSIKTWQAIIDFSVNRSAKCSKCSNDNYGSFSCSLSFLCPKLPIFPIPPFKIPNIYMDISHIDMGMNIVLPKINFVPVKIPLPQIPDLPEPPQVEVDRNILYGLDISLFKDMSLPTIPVIPEPPTLPEPPSFIPSIQMDLPVLPPAPKIPKILPEINAVLKVADFIGKIFCIVKGGIGLVGEKGVKGKIEQITQRTWNVPVFDYFNLTTKFKDPPLQGFDYQLDAYTTLKFNFDGVYDVFNSIANVANNAVSKNLEAPIQKAVNFTTDKLNNNPIVTGIVNPIENFDQNINFNGFNTKTEEVTGMIEYTTAYTELKQGLMVFENSTLTDKKMNDRIKTILATVENKSNILPATRQIQEVEAAAKSIIDKKIQENKDIQTEMKEYDKFIKKILNDQIVLVDAKTTSASLKTPILLLDAPTKKILQSQEDPTKTYLALNKNMVQGYLDAVNNDGPEKLNMTQSIYDKSKTYLETTKAKIDTALMAYSDTPVLAQNTCTNCSTNEPQYSTDISAYVQGVFVEAYSGDKYSTGSVKTMVNTVSSSDQIQNVQQTYTTDIDLNNDKLPDILMYDSNSIYVKYAKQESEHFSQGGNKFTKYYSTFYSYENTHAWNRYIASLDQLRNNTDAYGYITINDITIKVVDKNKETKNFKTEGQSFDNLQLSRQNSATLGETVDGYLLKVSNKIDNKDTSSSFWDFLGNTEKAKYIVVLPNGTDYKRGLLTIDQNFVKKPITIQLENTNILAVEYYDPGQEQINVTFKDLPRKRLYTSLATLTINQNDLSTSQKKKFTLYKKTSPRSNQTVAGMQNLGDTEAPAGEVALWRNTTNETISTGLSHEGFINTLYTLKSSRTDNVIVSKMIVQKDGITIAQKENTAQTGTIDIGGLFFTGATQQSYDFIAIDQNNNVAKETITVNIKIPEIEVVDLKKSGEATADIIAKISNDMDEGTVIFQRLRNGIWKNMTGSDQNTYGGFDLSPKQTIITGGIFTVGNDIGLYDPQGNEIANIDPMSGEIKINKGFENKVKIHLSFTTHVPVIELRDTVQNLTLFQIALPISAITNIEMNQGKPKYEQLHLTEGQFGAFNGGYCIKNSKNDCILYTNDAGAIYIPGMYANSLIGEYTFDMTNKRTNFVIKDESNKAIVTLSLQIKNTK